MLVTRGDISAFCSRDCYLKKKREKKTKSRKKISKGILKRIRRRDKETCRLCLKKYPQHRKDSPNRLHVHHIIYRSQGGKDTDDNLITLCWKCHDMVHRNKKRYQPLLLEAARLANEGKLVGVLDLESDDVVR